jgi:hypothetical protein
MVKLRFLWDGFSYFEDESENDDMELVEDYTGETWQECCDNCASCFDWNDNDLVTGESDCIETSREFTGIQIWDEEKKEYKEAPQEVYDYYHEAEERELREEEERDAKRKAELE